MQGLETDAELSKTSLTIHHQLKEFIAFLQEQEDEYITKTLDEGETKPMDCVRELEGGEGLGEDDIKKRLLEFGDKGLQELIACYAEFRHWKRRETIKYVLQVFYPSVEVQGRLEKIVAKETDPQRKDLYVDLLDSLRRTQG